MTRSQQSGDDKNGMWGGSEHDDNHEPEDWAAFISRRSGDLELHHQSYDRARVGDCSMLGCRLYVSWPQRVDQ